MGSGEVSGKKAKTNAHSPRSAVCTIDIAKGTVLQSTASFESVLSDVVRSRSLAVCEPTTL
jgi:hypothetical protein